MFIGMLYKYWVSTGKQCYLQFRNTIAGKEQGLEEIDFVCQWLCEPADVPFAGHPEIELGRRVSPRSSEDEDPCQPQEVLRPDESHCSVPEEHLRFLGSSDPVMMVIIFYLNYHLV